MLRISLGVSLLAMVVFGSSCKYEKSTATGWDYNNPDNGGFEKRPYVEQETGPGLVLIEGGRFTMGRTEQDVMYDWNNTPRTVTVSSFYMDETEVSNIHWLEYLYWVDRVYGTDYPEIKKKALPDTLVWRSKLGFNEPYVDYYLRHPAYRDYPVVGVNWLQANDFCKWRTDRVNEMILVREGLFEWNPNQVNEPFTTESYFAGQYEQGKKVEGVKNFNPNGNEYRNVQMEDGMLLPAYRLPTEAEWEYAAYALVGNSHEEWVEQRKVYPWNGHGVRRGPETKEMGQIMANFVRGRGDYMGVAGKLNDNAEITGPVYSYWPNDYGLYNMGGNVSEWVLDVYRPVTSEDMDEFRPYRGNVFKTRVLNGEGLVEDKFDIVSYDVLGVKEFLNKFSAIKEGKLAPDEVTLMDDCHGKADEAVELYKEDKKDESYMKVQEMVDRIKESELTIAPILLKGVSKSIDQVPGEIRWREVTPEENIDRWNYREAYNVDHLDGDLSSSIYYDNPEYEKQPMYQYEKEAGIDPTSLISNRARVYKGGSWKDRAYWLNPGSRRFLDERIATNFLGFRCAMTRVGSPGGLGGK